MKHTLEQLQKVFRVDTTTGKVYWLVRRPKHGGWTQTGDLAGYIPNENCGRTAGRAMLRYEGQTYQISRLVWLFATGAWPTQMIDHIDKDPTNDAFSNLRDVSNKENLQNVTRKPFYGIYFDNRKNCFCIELRHNGTRHKRQGWRTPEAAVPYRDKLLAELTCKY